jgi:hypothetical protein
VPPWWRSACGDGAYKAHVIASEAKQSRLRLAAPGLLRRYAPGNDGGEVIIPIDRRPPPRRSRSQFASRSA